MAAPDWSNTTQKLLKTANIPNNTEISFGQIRAAIGDTTKSIGASEWHRITDLDAPYNFPSVPTTSTPHLPYILDATENAGIPTSGAISPNQIKDVVKEYVIEQDPNKQEEEFDVGTLTGPDTPTAGVNWNSNLNKNITKYLKIRGRVISDDVSKPAVSIASSASSNLNIYVNNSPAGDGVMACGGAKGVSSGQPGGHAISITNPSAPATRVVYVECEGNESKIWAGGGGGYDGVDGVDGVSGSNWTGNGTDGVDGNSGNSGSPGNNGNPGNPGSDGSPGSSGNSGSPGNPGQSGNPNFSMPPGQWCWSSYKWRRVAGTGTQQQSIAHVRSSRRREWWSRYPSSNTTYSQNTITITTRTNQQYLVQECQPCSGGSGGSGGQAGSGGSGGGAGGCLLYTSDAADA